MSQPKEVQDRCIYVPPLDSIEDAWAFLSRVAEELSIRMNASKLVLTARIDDHERHFHVVNISQKTSVD